MHPDCCFLLLELGRHGVKSSACRLEVGKAFCLVGHNGFKCLTEQPEQMDGVGDPSHRRKKMYHWLDM